MSPILQTTLQIVLEVAALAAVLGLYRLRTASSSVPAGAHATPANLATRADVEELASRLDSMRSLQSTDTARLKSDDTHGSSLRQYQFEAELRTYEEVWATLVDVQRATESLQPMVEAVQISAESIRDARDRKRLAEFAAVFNAFTGLVQRRRPFFPPVLYVELQRLMVLAHGDAIDIAHVREHQNPEYWTSARENAEAITTQVDRIAEVIRDRLRLTGVA